MCSLAVVLLLKRGDLCRYGTDAAAVADAAFATAGNSYLTFYNTAALGPKGIAKRVAKVRVHHTLLRRSIN